MTPLSELEALAAAALRQAGASETQASATARALVAADVQGLATHGLSRIAQYSSHLRTGRVNGQSVPRIAVSKPAAVLIDAGEGLAYPACELAVQEAIARAKTQGVALAAVSNSHHFGAAAYHLEPVARAGLIGIALGNGPSAMPVPGGTRAILGTNPLAAAFPRVGAPPLVMDLAMSEVARGNLMVAAQKGEPIPLGWAFDENGQPTTDAKAGLRGTMLPFGSSNGGIKGALFAMLIELLVISLTGARFGAEVDTFFEEGGNVPRLGQVFLVFDPSALAGSAVYQERIETFIAAMCAEDGVRVPGDKREDKQRRAQAQGLAVPESILRGLRSV